MLPIRTLMAISGLALLIGGAYSLAQVGREMALRSNAETSSRIWVEYLQRNVPDLPRIAGGQEPSSVDRMYMDHGLDIKSAKSYALFDRDGRVTYQGGRANIHKYHQGGYQQDIQHVLSTGQPLLEVVSNHHKVEDHHGHGNVRRRDIEQSQDLGLVGKHKQQSTHLHHETHGDHSMHGGRDAHGTHVGHRMQGGPGMHGAHDANLAASLLPEDKGHDRPQATKQTEPLQPSPASEYVSVYFHPIVQNDEVVGVLAIDIDQNEVAKSFASTFRFLSIGWTALLIVAITPTVGFAWRRTIERRNAEQALRHLAFHDPLTHLPNRRRLVKELSERLDAARSERAPLFAMCLDLDGLKKVNDAHGHTAGDEFLRDCVGDVVEELSPGDFLARMGGDEFVLIPQTDSKAERVQTLASAIVDKLAKPKKIKSYEVRTGVSIGILNCTDRWPDPVEALRLCDLALYEAKSQGRGQVVRFEPWMDENLRQRQILEQDLRDAICHKQFVLHYQPQFRVRDQQLTGFEALVRWQHPTRGLLRPDEFIEIAEELRLIGRMTRQIMQIACADALQWPDDVVIAVNVSAVEFETEEVVGSIRDALANSGLSPQRLEIELTESTLMEQTDLVVRQLQEIHDMGVAIAMDDFGTGYSSLSYLWQYPFNKLKIDRSFLLHNRSTAQTRQIIETVVKLGHSLGLKVSAEGIERASDIEMLRRLSCDEAQGFHLGRPMALAKTLELVDACKPHGGVVRALESA